MKTRRLSLLALGMAAMATASVSAQSPERVEYFLDTDPGYGLAQIVDNISVGNNELTFDLSSAEAGAHILYVRAQDSEGRWSSTIARPLFINRLQDIVRVEYFFDDADPGIGLATPLSSLLQVILCLICMAWVKKQWKKEEGKENTNSDI